MKSVMLAGFSDKDAAAIEMMIGRRWPELKVVRLPRVPELSLPTQNQDALACDSCIVELGGCGLRMRTAEGEAQLEAFLSGRPSVLVWAGECDSWSQARVSAIRGRRKRLIKSPYTSTELLEAMAEVLAQDDEAALTPGRAATAMAPVKQANAEDAAEGSVDQSMPAWRRALLLAERLKRDMRSGADAGSVGKPATGNAESRQDAVAVAVNQGVSGRESGSATATATGMAQVMVPVDQVALGMERRRRAVASVLEVFPDLRTAPVMKAAQQLVAHDQALLVQLNRDVAMFGCIGSGWVASGISFRVLLRMLASSDILARVEMREMTQAQAEDMLRERFGDLADRMRHPVDMLIWELVSARIKGRALQPRGDLRLYLRSLPNFPLLESVGPLDIQLAAICGRGPQSISGLVARFPGHEQEVCRFAVLGLLSGCLGRVEEFASGSVATIESASRTATASAAQSAPPKRGVFKALLDRLFQA